MTSITATTTAPPAGQTQSRLLGPDLARGITLLGIAIANGLTMWALSKPADTTGGNVEFENFQDSIAVMLTTMFVHVRGLPMFATLLGYGLGMIYVRGLTKASSPRQVKKQIARRYAFLALLGAVHCVVLFPGEIMLSYAVLVLLLVFALHLSDKAILWLAGVMLTVGVVGYILVSVLLPGVSAGMFNVLISATYLEQVLTGLLMLVALPVTAFEMFWLVGPLILIGFVAGRRNFGAKITSHLPVAWSAIAVSLLVCFGIGVPWGLSVLNQSPAESVLAGINHGLGFLTGPGFVAIFFLLGHYLQHCSFMQYAPMTWILKLGKMSMTGYVLQSVIFTILVSPWGFGIGLDGSVFTVTAVSTVVWAITVVACGLYPGNQGPLEKLHRKLSYNKPTNPVGQTESTTK